MFKSYIKTHHLFLFIHMLENKIKQHTEGFLLGIKTLKILFMNTPLHKNI